MSETFVIASSACPCGPVSLTYSILPPVSPYLPVLVKSENRFDCDSFLRMLSDARLSYTLWMASYGMHAEKRTTVKWPAGSEAVNSTPTLSPSRRITYR